MLLDVVSVLPPIPTKDLTSADVSDLSERTRKVMLEALQDIAASRSSASTPPSSSQNGSAESAPLLASSSSADDRASSEEAVDAYGSLETEQEGDAKGRKTSAVMEREETGGKSGTEDELEEDGAVIVKRP